MPNGSRTPNEKSMSCGETVNYSCNDGFTLHGDSELKCDTGGALQGHVPTCKSPGDFENIFGDDMNVYFKTTSAKSNDIKHLRVIF